MPVFLSGKVVVDDGSPVPANTAIQRVCRTNPRTVAYVDSKGRFGFQWGDTSGLLTDASEDNMGGMGRMNGSLAASQSGRGAMAMANQLDGCELKAYSPGFTSGSINLSGHRAFDNPEVGTIVLHRLANVEGTSVSATALAAPKDAQKAYQKGLDLMHKTKTDEAAKDFEKAVAIYPKYANAWLDLGRARLAQKSEQTAQEAFLKAIDADGKLVEAYVELGLMASRHENWQDTAQYLDRALRLDPVDFPQTWFVDAVANYNLKNYDIAEKNVREALKLDPEHRNPRTEQLLGMALAQKQDYAGAGEALRNYIKLAPNAPDIEQVKTQLTQIEALAPKQ